MKKKLIMPSFKDEKKVQEWLDNTDFSEYIDTSDVKPAHIAELIKKSEPKTKPITIRLPEPWILKAKALASQMDMPYQTFMKQLIRKGLHL
jgi:predicted DNA binding CopG/RHH family protein